MATTPGNEDFIFHQRQHEESVLGAALLLPSCTTLLNEIIQPSDFVSRPEREIYRTIVELYREYPDIDATGILKEMRKRDLADQDHNSAWIGMLVNRSNVNQALTYDAIELRRLAKLKRLQRVAAEAFNLKADPDAIYSTLQDGAQWTATANQDDWEANDFVALRGDKHFPDRGTEVIKGVLRDSEVCLVVASSKDGKSWFAGQLGWCVVTGTPFLGLDVEKGSVLLIDNELPTREIDFRHSQITKALEHNPQPGEMTVVPRRGKPCDVNLLASCILKMDLTGYRLIIIDALYKTIPDGKSENDNEAMGKLMNVLQYIAGATGVPIVAVHHATKGDQSHKSSLDMAAGAGSLGRSLDSLIAIRDHETEGYNVCEFKTRTNKPAEAISVSFDWPLWHATTLTPEVRRPKQGSAERREKDDKEADELLLAALQNRPNLSEAQLVRSTGMGPSRVSRAVGRAIAAKTITEKKIRRQNRKVVVYLPSATESATAKNISP